MEVLCPQAVLRADLSVESRSNPPLTLFVLKLTSNKLGAVWSQEVEGGDLLGAVPQPEAGGAGGEVQKEVQLRGEGVSRHLVAPGELNHPLLITMFYEAQPLVSRFTAF
ncbi:hypothetical protein NHX12_031277 [Muraenolepis orangiensis]|uniref:Uncharacterized protein n=1 Tax=Muraenolepis orangiensis TaxID=630683 RepID=A0A9Q0E500_9TELE|nr:hypothetical protein NHX12_031277 [Muraenolepis orangiensis]